MSWMRWVCVDAFQTEQFVVCSDDAKSALPKLLACDVPPQPSRPRPERIDERPQPIASVGRTPGAGALWLLPGLGGVWNQSHPTVGRPVLCGPPQSNSSASFTGFSVPMLGTPQPGR